MEKTPMDMPLRSNQNNNPQPTMNPSTLYTTTAAATTTALMYKAIHHVETTPHRDNEDKTLLCALATIIGAAWPFILPPLTIYLITNKLYKHINNKQQ